MQRRVPLSSIWPSAAIGAIIEPSSQQPAPSLAEGAYHWGDPMHSYAQPSDFACPQCGQPFRAEIWLVIDVSERPDLAARARTGDLHAVACPRCGPLGRVDAPLLIYLPDADPATGQPPLIFSPAQQTSAEQDQEQAGGLLGQLAGRLGDAWQDDWLAQVASVRRDLLPAALSDDPAAAMQKLMEDEATDTREMPPAIEAALRSIGAALAAEGVIIDSAEALEHILADRPDLRARLEAA